MGIQRDWGRHLQRWSSTQPFSEYINSDRQPYGRRNRRSNRTGNKFLRLLRSIKSTSLYNNNTRSKLSIYPKLFWTWANQPNNNSKNNHSRKRYRYHKYLYTITTLCSIISPNAVLAQGVGGVSATANPIANSSGSVTNQAIQVLQGPYITNTYGNQISCQGATANFTPYVQFADSRKDPWEDFYNEPQYNMTDLNGLTTKQTVSVKNYPWESWYDDRTYVNDDGDTVRWFPDGQSMEIEIDVDGPDGIPDAVQNGEMAPTWHKPVRTDMRANQNFNVGLSATLSMPLDRKLTKLCKEAATTQISLQQQLVANKRLDFEIARLKNCGELKQAGIQFYNWSSYASICADVQVTAPGPNILPDHTHKLGNTTSSETSSSSDDPSQNSSEANPSSLDTDSSVSQKQLDGKGFFRGLSLPWQKPSSQEALSPSLASQL